LVPFWYTLLLALIAPLYRLRVYLRSREEPDYHLEVSQRFGPLPAPHIAAHFGPPVWVHAVSVGETNAARPLILHLLELGLSVLVTNTTRTGAARVQALFAESIADQQLEQHFLPLDSKALMTAFIALHRPRALLMIETEIWPNLLALTAAQQIPSMLINARLSERSARGYARFAGLTQPMLRHISLIAAQDQDTAQRFIDLGSPVDQVVVTGSLKFDLTAPPAALTLAHELQAKWPLAGRRIIVAASTHEPEEAQLLTQFKILHTAHPEYLLILVPRHPQRFERVAELIKEHDFQLVRRSLAQAIAADTAVYFADSMGELWTWFSLSDAAFIGGSLSENGGHNPLEPASLGVPVVMGPHTFNFAQIVALLKGAGALVQVDDVAGVAQVWTNWLSDETSRKAASDAALRVMAANQGALQRQLDLVDKLIAS
jgi:3-deoxy-D-manno-octulosonic-acid transferase